MRTRSACACPAPRLPTPAVSARLWRLRQVLRQWSPRRRQIQQRGIFMRTTERTMSDLLPPWLGRHAPVCAIRFDSSSLRVRAAAILGASGSCSYGIGLTRFATCALAGRNGSGATAAASPPSSPPAAAALPAAGPGGDGMYGILLILCAACRLDGTKGASVTHACLWRASSASLRALWSASGSWPYSYSPVTPCTPRRSLSVNLFMP
mmetsp:Transcript_23145/g.68801  ORF Transcript_23145/g.68801 Transcript_23145/m.68801 type:complete len:208 (+) Transcript_23145:561-1184(+)